MLVDRYVPKTNHFIKLMVGFQFHFNRFNGVEKIVDEKNDNILVHPPTRTKQKNRIFWHLDETPCKFWQKRQVLKFNLIEYYNL